MKIAIFHTEFVYSGGAERIVFEEYKYLVKQKYEVEIYSASLFPDKCYPKEIKKYPIISFVPKFFLFLPNDILIILSFFFLPFFLFKLSKYDLILAHNQAGPWWAYICHLFLKIDYLTYQNYPTTITYPRKIDLNARRNNFLTEIVLKLFKRPIIFFDKKAILNAKFAFAIGKYVQKVCQKAYRREFVDVPGGIYLQKFNLKIFQKRFFKAYILITNRHFPAKEMEWGIKTLSLLKKSLSNSGYKNKKVSQKENFLDRKINNQQKEMVKKLKLFIAGSKTEYTKDLINLTRKLSLEKDVVFLGLLEGREKESVYRNALIYFYTAPEEDFGLGNIEAMSHGVPVIAWNNAGPKYIIKDGQTGFLIPLNNLQEMYLKTLKLLDRKLNYKFAQKSFLEAKNYTWQVHCQKIFEKIKLI